MANVLQQEITAFIRDHGRHPLVREPLVGFAVTDDPLFPQLKMAVGPNHLLPSDLLTGARSVVSFFLPFKPELVRGNYHGATASRDWAEAYIAVNALIADTCAGLQRWLAGRGVAAAFARPTHNFDQVELVSFWSHKHVAYIAGLGTFGRHQMLITRKGCAGRLGSLVVDVTLSPSRRPDWQYCPDVGRPGACGSCFRRCPTGALTPAGLDKMACYQHLLAADATYSDLDTCDVCGKCACGPCALAAPGYNKMSAGPAGAGNSQGEDGKLCRNQR